VPKSERWSKFVCEHGAPPQTPDNLTHVRATYDQLLAELGELARLLGHEDVRGEPDHVRATLDALLADTTTLGRLPDLHRLRTALHAVGLAAFLDDCGARSLNPEATLAAFEYAWLWSVVDHIRLTDPLVATFDGDQQSRTVAEFEAADRRHVETTAQRVRRLVAEQAPSPRTPTSPREH
jgi:hypothetical protein